jgi:hypothetical protein
MLADQTPEEAAVAILTDQGTSRVVLRLSGLPDLVVCRHPNPGVSREVANRLRGFLAAFLLRDREGRP